MNGGAPNYLLTGDDFGVVGLVWLRWVGGVLFAEEKTHNHKKKLLKYAK